MIKEFFTQNEWLGINFSELPVELYSDKLPSAEFYSLFYRELDKKYIDLSQFPIEWLKIKLNQSTQKGISSSSSIGAGGGGT
jgi:hypothetical protein